MKKSNKRRQFLKNTSLGVLGLGLLPSQSQAKTTAAKPLVVCNPTTLDLYGEGPFYTENPPTIEAHQLANADEEGERIIISGRVYNLECTEVIPNTIIDVWHANHAGQYDNDTYNLRGKTTTNEQGFYMFETIKPGKYNNGGQFRPSHIHFKITAPGFSELITQLYFAGDESIPIDAAASVTSGTYDASHRIIPLTLNNDGVLEGTWDIVINGSGVTAVGDLHVDKGVIYTASPNPFSEELHIRYGIFKRSKVSLQVFDLRGVLIANLEERDLAAQKYEAIWRPDAYLPSGYYFIVLRINDLQVHYIKVQKQ